MGTAMSPTPAEPEEGIMGKAKTARRPQASKRAKQYETVRGVAQQRQKREQPTTAEANEWYWQ